MLAFAQIGGVVAPVGGRVPDRAVRLAVAFFVVRRGRRRCGRSGFWFWFRDDPAAPPRGERGGTAPTSGRRGAARRPPTPARCRGARCSRTAASSSSPSSWCSRRSSRTSSTRWFPKYLQAARGVGNVECGLAQLARHRRVGGRACSSAAGSPTASPAARRTRSATAAASPGRVPGRGRAACSSAPGAMTPTAAHCCCARPCCVMHFQLPNWWSVDHPAGRPAHRDHLRPDERHRRARGDGVAGVRGLGRRLPEAVRGLTGRDAWDPIFDVYVVVLVGGAAAWWLYRFTPLEESPSGVLNHAPRSEIADIDPG